MFNSIQNFVSKVFTGNRKFIGLIVFSLGLSFLVVFRLDINAVSIGLDNSWIYAINYAALKNVNWGSDFLFTYGPFGYLVHTLDLGSHVYHRLLFEVVFAAVCGIAVACFLGSLAKIKYLIKFILVPLLLFVISIQYFEWRFMALLLLFILTFQKNKHQAAVEVIIGWGIGWLLLTKFSIGLTALITLISCSLFKGSIYSISRSLISDVISVLSSFIFWWFLVHRNLRGIVLYVLAQMELVKGYSQAMSLVYADWQFLVWYLLFILVILLVWCWFIIKNDRAKSVMVVTLIPLFFAWKSAISRQDSHLLILFFFILFESVILFVYAFTRTSIIKALIPLVLVFIMVSDLAANQETTRDIYAKLLLRPLSSLSGYDLKKLHPNNFSAARNELREDAKSDLVNLRLSPMWLKEIGTSTIDIYPLEISYIAANNLNWRNRPVIQSYAAFTPYLDKLGADFFAATCKPEYILWHEGNRIPSSLETIDQRQAFLDEPMTSMQIINNYDLLDSDINRDLLKVRVSPRFGITQLLVSENVAWNSWIKVPAKEKGVIGFSTTFSEPVLLKFFRFLLFQPRVSLSLQFKSGEEATYRWVFRNGDAKFWINPFIKSKSDLRYFLLNQTAQEVNAIRFDIDTNNFLLNDINLTWYTMAYAK